MNLLSPAHQPLSGSAGGPGLYTSPSPCASSGGFSVTVLPAITSFFSSLSPGYVPEGGLRQLVASTTANAGETAVRKSGQHDTDAVLDKVKLACTIASCWVPTARVVTEAVATICSSFALAQSLGSVLERKDGEQQSSEKQSSAPCHESNGAAAATLLTLVALDNLAPAAAVPAPCERGSPQQPIEVSNSTTLSKIGQPGYPTDAYYLQTQSFSHNRTVPGPAFQGHYQGGCHTISDLKTCLFRKLDRYGVVRDLHLTNATIDGDVRHLGAVACEMAPFTSVRDMHIEHIKVTNRGLNTRRGENAGTGIVVGRQHRSATISGMRLHNCSVSTTARASPAGIIGGVISGLAQDINVTDSRVDTRGRLSEGGIGAGLLHGKLDQTTVVGSRVGTNSDYSDAGIGAGSISGGHIRHFAASDCRVTTRGEVSDAGVGGGVVLGELDQLTVVDCHIETDKEYSNAGVGAGSVGASPPGEQGRLKDLISVNNQVITKGRRACASIGSGQLNGEAENIVAVNCSVKTEGPDSPGAIGIGTLNGQLKGLTAVNSTVETLEGSPADVDTAETSTGDSTASTVIETKSLNTRVNDRLIREGSQVLVPFCTGADPRFLLPDCQVIPTPLATVSWNCSSERLAPAHGSVWQPIEVDDISILNNIGLNDYYPSSAHYFQTADLNGSGLRRNESLEFNGHYDGRNHSIEGLQTCLFTYLRGTVKNLRLTDARISGYGSAVVAAIVHDAGAIERVHLSNCRVTNREIAAPAGLVCAERIGKFNRVAYVVVHNSTLETSGISAPAGMVGGICDGRTEGVYIHSSRVVTHGDNSDAGLGCGVSRNVLDQMVSTCSEVKTHGNGAAAGIGAGVIDEGWLGPLTSVNSSVATRGVGALAGIGAGVVGRTNVLEKINAVHSKVTTTGAEASAGIAAGVIGSLGRATNVTAVHCEVITRGNKAHAGVCTGDKRPLSIESYCTSINSSAYALGENSRAYLTDSGQRKVTLHNSALNTRLNGRLFDTGDVGNHSTLCSSADSRFIRPDCQTTLSQSCPMLQGFYLPPAASLATGLSTGAIAGIVAGGAVVLLGAGYCFYRRCHTGGEKQERRAGPV